MSGRQFVNQHPRVMATLVVAFLGMCVWVLWGQASAAAGLKPSKSAYFTTDEGKTWFADDIGKLPPFDKDGKEAVRVHLFQCGDKAPVVGYLERYTTKGKEVTERYRTEQKSTPGQPPRSLGDMISLGRNATEVKKPGDKKWTPAGLAPLTMTTYDCGGGGTAAVVMP